MVQEAQRARVESAESAAGPDLVGQVAEELPNVLRAELIGRSAEVLSDASHAADVDLLRGRRQVADAISSSILRRKGVIAVHLCVYDRVVRDQFVSRTKRMGDGVVAGHATPSFADQGPTTYTGRNHCPCTPAETAKLVERVSSPTVLWTHPPPIARPRVSA